MAPGTTFSLSRNMTAAPPPGPESASLSLCDPMGCSPPDSSVRGISQARMLECVAVFFFGGSSQSRNGTWVFGIGRRFLYQCATRKRSAREFWLGAPDHRAGVCPGEIRALEVCGAPGTKLNSLGE